MEKCTERQQKRERLKKGRKEGRRKGWEGREGKGRKEGKKEGRKEGRKGGKEGHIVAPRRKTPNFRYLRVHTNACILPNKHLTKTANTIPRHQTRTHIRTTLFIYFYCLLFDYLMTPTIAH